MKTITSVLFIIASLFFASCEKDTDTITDINLDSLNAILPKQVISTDKYADPATLVHSIKYDTTNLMIEFYEDDINNSNPYDQFYARYSFNPAGYLIRFLKSTQGMNEESIVQRASDNKIQWIAHSDVFLDQIDTTYFYYSSVGGQTQINTTKKEYQSGTLVYVDSLVHIYDTDWKLLQVIRGNNVTNYQYNANKSLKKTITETSNTSYTSELTYASGLTVGKNDVVMQVFLGKDYYIQHLQDLYLLASFIDREYLAISATSPFHPTGMLTTMNENGTISTEQRNWRYELNGQKQLGKITANMYNEDLVIVELIY